MLAGHLVPSDLRVEQISSRSGLAPCEESWSIPARNRGHKERGGSRAHVTLSDAGPFDEAVDLHDLITLNDELTRLEALDPRQAKVVEMRCYGPLTLDVIAQRVGVSRRTVEGDRAHALAWLRREISRTWEHA